MQTDRNNRPRLFFSNGLEGCRVHILPTASYQTLLQHGRVSLDAEWLTDSDNDPRPGPCVVIPDDADDDLWDTPSPVFRAMIPKMMPATLTTTDEGATLALAGPSLYELLPMIASGVATFPEAWQTTCAASSGVPLAHVEYAIRAQTTDEEFLGIVEVCSCDDIGCGANFAWTRANECLLFLQWDACPIFRVWLFPNALPGPVDHRGLSVVAKEEG